MVAGVGARVTIKAGVRWKVEAGVWLRVVVPGVAGVVGDKLGELLGIEPGGMELGELLLSSWFLASCKCRCTW